MITEDQLRAVRAVRDAVEHLNSALDEADRQFVLVTVETYGTNPDRLNAVYRIASAATCEQIMEK